MQKEWIGRVGIGRANVLEGDEKHRIVIECNSDALEDLVPLLQELEGMGHRGNTRSIIIEGWEGGENNFEFDGDGPSRIHEIKIDGKLAKQSKINNFQTQLIKLGHMNPDLRKHLRPIITVLDQKTFE